MKAFYKIVLLQACCFFTLLLSAQNLNLVSPINITLPNNPSANTDDWGKAGQILIITAKKNTPNELQSWMLVTIKQGGSKICGSNTPQTATEVNFDIPLKTWTGSNAASLLGNPCTLKPGEYELCVQFYLKDRRTVIGENCKSFSIKETKPETYSPPQNILPAADKIFTRQEANGMINFRWTPVLPKPKENVVYRLKVWQLMQGQNSTQAMKSNQPVITKEMENITQASIAKLNGEPCMLPYLCSYVWKVEASKTSALGDIEMLGTSEATSFSVKEKDADPVKYSPPVNQSPVDGKVFTEKEASQPIVLRWTPVLPRPKEDVVYKVRVLEIRSGQSKAEALRSNKPAALLEVKNETQVNFKLAQRSNGIVWIVEASKTSALGDIEMLGTSEATSFSVKENDVDPVKYGPPVNQSPADGKVFTEKEATQPIVLRWTPVLPRPKEDVIYKVSVWDIPVNRSKTEAIKINKPIEILEVKNETQATLKLSKRCNDCEYVWRVEASKKSAMGDIEMLGVSEATGFSTGGLDCSCTAFDKFTSKPYVQLNGSHINVDSVDCNGKLSTKLQCNVKYDFAIQHQFLGMWPNNPCGHFDSAVIKNATGVVIASQQHVNPVAPISYTFTQSGNYTITYYLKKNGIICKECKMNFVVECPAAQNCCKNSNWYNKNWYGGNPLVLNGVGTVVAQLPASGINLGTWPCAVPSYAFHCSFACANNCTGQINYSVYSIATGTLVSTQTIANATYASIPAITTNGNYLLVIAAICGKDTCSNTLQYPFEIKCTPPTNCCQNATQKDPSVYDAAGTKLATFSCAQPKAYYINTKSKNCDKDLIIKASASCGTNANCPAKIIYNLVNTVTSAAITGTGFLTIPATLANGSYVLTVDYYCGNSICKTCKFEIIKDCLPVINDCCKNSGWGEKIHYKSGGITGGAVPAALPASGSNLGAVSCGSIKQFKVCYNCAQGCGAAQIKYDVYLAYSLVLISSSTVASCSIANITMPATAGNYQVRIAAICNGKECSAIDYFISTECKAVDCCKGSFWTGKSLDWDIQIKTLQMAAKMPIPVDVNAGPANPTNGSIKINKCGDTIRINEGGQYTFNAGYTCNSTVANCKGKVIAKVKDPNGITYGTWPLPHLFSFAGSGIYTVTYYAYCGETVCDSCTFYVNAAKDCCKGSEWKKAQYQVTNKKPNGDWDKTDKTYYSLPFTITNPIPVIKADVAIDLEKLEFSCAQGCTSGFILKRKNITTGVEEAPEMIAAGGTPSVYAKPYPQLITIVPTCGGISCGKPIVFKLDCLHKNCAPPCATARKTLNFTTGLNAAGVQIANGAKDPFWSTGKTFEGLTGDYETWNKINGASILIPSEGPTVAGTFSFKRCFYVCEETVVSFTGVFRDDNIIKSFVLKNATTNSVAWSLAGTSLPTNDPQCYSDNSFSGSASLPNGQYCFEFTYRNWGGVGGGFALKGTLTSTEPVLSNTEQECCANTVDKTAKVKESRPAVIKGNNNNARKGWDGHISAGKIVFPPNSFAIFCPTGTVGVDGKCMPLVTTLGGNYAISDGLLNGKKELMNSAEINNIAGRYLQHGVKYQFKGAVIKYIDGADNLVIVYYSETDKTIQTILIPLINENGYLKMQGISTLITQVGAKQTISKGTEVSSKKHDYVGHVTLLR